MNIPCTIIGVKDTFSTHGTQKELRKTEGIDAGSIVETVLSLT